MARVTLLRELRVSFKVGALAPNLLLEPTIPYYQRFLFSCSTNSDSADFDNFFILFTAKKNGLFWRLYVPQKQDKSLLSPPRVKYHT